MSTVSEIFLRQVSQQNLICGHTKQDSRISNIGYQFNDNVNVRLQELNLNQFFTRLKSKDNFYPISELNLTKKILIKSCILWISRAQVFIFTLESQILFQIFEIEIKHFDKINNQVF